MEEGLSVPPELTHLQSNSGSTRRAILSTVGPTVFQLILDGSFEIKGLYKSCFMEYLQVGTALHFTAVDHTAYIHLTFVFPTL